MKKIMKSSCMVIAMICAACALHAQPFELVSKSGDANFYAGLGNQNSDIGCSMSADGSRMSFASNAFNLFSTDINNKKDVFIFEPVGHSLAVASVKNSGELASGSSPALSASGRYITFNSSASNLPGANGSSHIYRYDSLNGNIEIVSLMDDGSTMPSARDSSISAGGNFLAFRSDNQIWLRDIALGQTTLISKAADGTPANDDAFQPKIAASGDYVVFYSSATNLVPDDTNNQRDVFVYDRIQDSLSRIMAMGNTEPNLESSAGSISANGRWIAFDSLATNLVPGDSNAQRDVFLYDRQSGSVQRISEDASGIGGNATSSNAAISQNGRFVIFNSRADNLVAGLTDNKDRIFLYDRLADHLLHIDNEVYLPLGSCIGNNASTVTIAFSTTSHPLVPQNISYRQILLERFEIDAMTGPSLAPSMSTIASSTVPALRTVIGDAPSDDPALSADGRYLSLTTEAGNILGAAPAIRQLVRMDLQTEAIDIASLDLDGAPADGNEPSISAQGRYIAFRSGATTLVDDDTNSRPDIFVRDLTTDQTLRASIASDGSEANDSSDSAVISADGSAVVFRSQAENLVVDDSNGQRDIFVHHLASRITERVSISTLGMASTDRSSNPDISASGRFVVFQSRSNLTDDGNLPVSCSQIWLRDLQLATTELISRLPDGSIGDGCNSEPQISDNGGWIVFTSTSPLDPAFPDFPPPPIEDEDEPEAMFLHDRQTGMTQLVSLSPNGEPLLVDSGPVQAADSSAILFRGVEPDPLRRLQPENVLNAGNSVGSLYVRYPFESRTQQIHAQTVDGLPPNSELEPHAIDTSGRHAYVVSSAGNLISGMNNGVRDIYRVDLDILLRDGFETGIAGKPGPGN